MPKHQPNFCVTSSNPTPRQAGPPDLFLTVAPYEWTWPWHVAVEHCRQQLGRSITNAAALETLHLTHVLLQMIKGFVAGATGNKPTKWREFLCADKRRGGSCVQCIFWRLEYQEGSRKRQYHGRGTPHVHVLVWLKNSPNVCLERILLGSLPWQSDPYLAALAAWAQRSEQPTFPTARDAPSRYIWHEATKRWLFQVRYTVEMCSLVLRCFLAPLMRVFRCHQDVQTNELSSVGLLLTYAAGYVSKFSEGFSERWLQQEDTSWEAARRVANLYRPLEPQMLVDLSRQPSAWTTARTKRLWVGTPDEEPNAMLLKYRQREDADLRIWKASGQIEVSALKLCLVDWLRACPAVGGRQARLTGVGLNIAALPADAHFGQWLCAYVPHQDASELLRPEAELVHPSYRWFTCAYFLSLEPDKVDPKYGWHDLPSVQTRLELQGHRREHVRSMLLWLEATIAVVRLWVSGSLEVPRSLDTPGQRLRDHFSPHQQVPYNRLLAQIQARGRIRSDEEGHVERHGLPYWATGFAEDGLNSAMTCVTGGPGAGKSAVAQEVARTALDMGLSVLVATPAARLGDDFRVQLPGAAVATMHAAFLLPVASSLSVTLWPVNESLQEYDLWVLDEVSMWSSDVLEHVCRTWLEGMRWPAVLLLGDFDQLPPVGAASGARAAPSWRKHVHHLHLPGSMRSADPPLLTFLSSVRAAVPSKRMLDEFVTGRVLADAPSKAALRRFFVEVAVPGAVALTMTNAGAWRLNSLALDVCRRDAQAMGHIECWQSSDGRIEGDEFAPKLGLFKHVRLVLTKNTDKGRGLVNGATAELLDVLPSGLLLKLSSGLVTVLPPLITRRRQRRVFAVQPGYAMTIWKAQGLTLPAVLLWFDSSRAEKGLGYVAVSRVRRKSDLYFVGKVQPTHFQPANI